MTASSGNQVAGMGMPGVEGDMQPELGGHRQTKTASGSRTQKSTTSYSLTAHRQGTSNDQFEENMLPQMAVNRQQNMSGNSKRLGRINN